MLCFFPLPTQSEIASRQKARVEPKSHLIWSLSCRFSSHSPVLPFVQCLKTVVSHILSRFIVVYCRRVSLVLVTPSFMAGSRNI